ncbi:hypothetical protein [Fluviicola sp.]|uniref:hypothetical protein n=1 Tax=Fluviicola sp. TaxID=1917219 RepID=UPI0031D48474
MKKIIFLFCLILFNTFTFSQKIEIDSPKSKGQNNQEVREEYRADGTYVRYRGNRLEASGFHKNKVFDGVLKIVDGSGRVKTSTTYKMGVKDGEETEHYGLDLIRRNYTNGIKTGYETRINADSIETFRMGPFFAGAKKELVFLFRVQIPYKENQMLEKLDTIFLKSNTAAEIHRWHFSRRNDVVVDTLFHAVCKLQMHAFEEYTVGAVQELIQNATYSSDQFDFYNLDRPKEVVVYQKDGSVSAKTFPVSRFTFYSNGKLKDSIVVSENKEHDCHFRFDERGNLVFKAKKEVLSWEFDHEKTFRWTYDYFKDNQVSYTISTVNFSPEKIVSSDPLINKAIAKGMFTGMDGTVYMTRPDGIIDTAYSQELFPLRYRGTLKTGRYYYLNLERKDEVEAVEVTADGISFIRVNLTNPDQVSKRKKMNIVFQRDSLYLMYDYLNTTDPAKKIILSKSGRLYASDFRRNSLDFPWYESIEELAIESKKDSVIRFRTLMLPEKEFQEALKLKSISTLPKSEFMECVSELDLIRTREHAVKKNLSPEESRMLTLVSRQLFHVFYHKGYNPYFSADELKNLMQSYGFTKEESHYVKSVIRI